MGDAVRIDPLSWRLTGLDRNRLYTDADLDALEPLICPACGHDAAIDRIPVTRGGWYLPGHWRCHTDPGHTSAPLPPPS